jgi:hypothetical protein
MKATRPASAAPASVRFTQKPALLFFQFSVTATAVTRAPSQSRFHEWKPTTDETMSGRDSGTAPGSAVASIRNTASPPDERRAASIANPPTM